MTTVPRNNSHLYGVSCHPWHNPQIMKAASMYSHNRTVHSSWFTNLKNHDTFCAFRNIRQNTFCSSKFNSRRFGRYSGIDSEGHSVIVGCHHHNHHHYVGALVANVDACKLKTDGRSDFFIRIEPPSSGQPV